MRIIFKEPKLQKEFDEKGYVILPSFLNASEVQSLQEFYLAKKNKAEVNLKAKYNPHNTAFSIVHCQKTFRKMAYKKITSIVEEKAHKYLKNYKPLIANYVTKAPHGQGHLAVHQNWSVVDEYKYTSVSIWCPLVDTEIKNGGLQFIDGSHKMFRYEKRGARLPPFHNIEQFLIDKYLKPVSVKAGQAIILDDSVIHYSPPNLSKFTRIAVQTIMIPKEAPALYYCTNTVSKGDKVDVFEVEPPYFWELENWNGPKEHSHLLKSITIPQYFYNEETFVKAYKYGISPNNNKSSFFAFFKNLFKN